MQVPVLSLVFMTLSALVAIGLPITLFMVFRTKQRMPFVPLLVGMGAFVLFALILERSLHSLILPRFNLKERPLAYVLYGIFAAGIFEETARFISFHLLKKKYTGLGAGLSYGLGHGGIEALLLAGLPLINNLILGFMLNTGALETMRGGLQGEALGQLNAQISALAATSPWLFLVSGIERIFALGAQMALSIIVFCGVVKKNKGWLFPGAIVLHAVLDIPAALMQAGLLGNIFLVEGLVGLGSAAALVIAKKIHQALKQEE
jgi:uncharacterized membrane protein YhfC